MGATCVIESDHNPLICKLNIKWDNRIRCERKKVFKIKDAKGLNIFNELTSNCPKLVQLSENSSNFLYDATKWMGKIQDIMHKSFKKIRLSGKMKHQNSDIDNLMEAKQKLRNKLGKISGKNNLKESIEKNIEIIEKEISTICAEKNSIIVKRHLSEISKDDEHVSRLNMWRLKQKICPRNIDPPMAKKAANGDLISNPDKLKNLYVDTYKYRLRHRTIQPGLEEIERIKNYLFNIRLSLSKTRKSAPWSTNELIKVLESLKSGKSCDALGFSNELFKPGVIGCDLVQSLLNIINRAKDEITVPRPFRLTKITSIYKNKGEKCDLNSDRGVHSVTKFRAIIDKLLYRDKYKEIDRSMSNCNVGGRKNRSIRDNLFVIYAVINDALGYQKIDIDMHFYDISQCFDSMWYQETMNDMWDSMEIRDDKFALISEMNREVDLFVKTPVGDTKVFTVEEIEQQGTGLGPIKCSNQMDTIPRECVSENIEMFKYRNAVTVPPLGMIDDLAVIAKCGPQSVILNAVINAKINLKKLEFNKNKCVKLHICKDQFNCSKSQSSIQNMKCVFLEVQKSEMKSAENEKYIGDVISQNGSNDANVSRRRSQGIGAISQIFALLNEISLGYHYIEIGLILREAILLSKMLLSAESWHRLFLYQIEKLEEVDRMFFRKLFNAHAKTGTEVYYIESGSIPLNIKISMKRLLYWWHILSIDKSEMLFKIYKAQQLSRVHGDWIELLDGDKNLFDIKLSDEEIKSISKLKFKRFVKKKAEELTIKYLKGLKNKHSKSTQLEVNELETSSYLLHSRLSKEERELLFKLRSKTISVKGNFKNAYVNNNMLCELCQLFPCTQSHPLQCPKLEVKMVVDRKVILRDNFVYGSIDKQILYTKIYKQFWDLRDQLLKQEKEHTK